jgi:hypothetical protein
MGVVALTDPAEILNAKASAQGWPLQCDSHLTFKQPELTMLRDVWRSKAAKVGLPTRGDLGAHALKSVLRHLAILERVSSPETGSRYRVLHMGTYIAAVMGERTGRFIDETIPAALLPRWTSPFDTVLSHRIPLRILSKFEYEKLDFASGESFLAPLSDDAGKPNILMSCLYIKPRES